MAHNEGMTILICPDSFKGTLTARDAAEAIARGVSAARPDAKSLILPLADGGEGTLDALLANGGERRSLEVEGPAGARVRAEWGILPDGAAVIEMAQASGLKWVKPEENDLLTATSHGAGRLIREAVDAGCRRLIVGIGGSATNDGGMGAMRALGARFLDADGNELERGGAALARLKRFDLSALMDFSAVDVEVATDVDNPLCGPDGATHTFGPQKGGSPEDLETLEAAMCNYAHRLNLAFDWDIGSAPGSGAAGGMGAALLGFLRAQFRSGVDMVMDALGFDDAAQEADLIITGEGRLDRQSLRGKAISGIVRRAEGRPVLALCGRVDLDEDAWRDFGLSGAWGLENMAETAADARANPAAALERLARLALLTRG